MISFRRHLHDRELSSTILGALGACLIGLGKSPEHLLWQLLAGLMGYGLIILAMSKSPTKKRAFFTGWVLFSIAFLMSSRWFLSHPFSYIIGVWAATSIFFALPYALLTIQFLSMPSTLSRCIGFATFYAALEHLFASLPCGYSFQCAALHITEGPYAIQLASTIGGLGISCIVYLTNLLFFHAIETKTIWPVAVAFVFPYAIGGSLYMQRTCEAKDTPFFTAAICHFENPPHIDGVYLPPDVLHEREWQKVFQCLLPIVGKKVDLIVLPEGTIPFSANALLHRSATLPPILQDTSHGLLSSIDIATKIASRCKAPILIGLEGRKMTSSGECESYNSCFYIAEDGISTKRYDKQLLLPLGEYIPFSFLAKILSYYGIHSSFTPGKNASIFPIKNQRIAPLICYEETFSDYACQAYQLHPTILIGLSNDVWYPSVRYQHFELARLRAAELGIPLIRSCNFGISAACDSIGNTIETAGSMETTQNSCFIVKIPIASHFSLFAKVGERGVACILLVLGTLICRYGALVFKRQIFKSSKSPLEAS